MTRPDVVGGDHVADVDLARVEVDVDAGHAGRPAEGRVGIAAVGVVVEVDARVRLEPLVDAQRAVVARVVATYASRTAPPVAARTCSRSRPAALMSRPPTTIAVRDATVGPESGTNAVSCGAISTSSIGDAERVGDELREDRLGPLPHLGRGGQDAQIRPSAVSSSEATLASLTSPEPVNPAPCQASARPMPLTRRARDPCATGRRRDRARARAPPPRVVGPRPQPGELGGLRGPLEDLLAGHAVAQDLAGRRRVAGPVDVAPADVERRDPELLGDPVQLRSRPRTRSAARRIRGRRRSAACWSGSRGRGSGRSGSGTARRQCSAPRDSTTGVSVQYAPPSMTTSMSWATSVPSRVTPVRWRTIAGWRLVVAAMSSCRS